MPQGVEESIQRVTDALAATPERLAAQPVVVPPESPDSSRLTLPRMLRFDTPNQEYRKGNCDEDRVDTPKRVGSARSCGSSRTQHRPPATDEPAKWIRRKGMAKPEDDGNTDDATILLNKAAAISFELTFALPDLFRTWVMCK